MNYSARRINESVEQILKTEVVHHLGVVGEVISFILGPNCVIALEALKGYTLLLLC